MKSYAVLLAPNFRLQSLLRHAPHLKGVPVVLLDAQGRKPRVCELNEAASSARVEIGMTPTQAMARCADLRTLSANAGHERAAQDTLLQTAEMFSPFLESTAPGVITVELPLHKPPTEKDLRQKWIEPLSVLGLKTRATD